MFAILVLILAKLSQHVNTTDGIIFTVSVSGKIKKIFIIYVTYKLLLFIS